MLHGQVQVAREFGHLRIGLDQAVGELDRVRGREADAIDAIDRSDVIDQRREIGNLAIVHQPPVRIDILAQQVDLAYALCGQRGDLGNDVIERAADLLAARVRHDAKAAVLAATFHDGHECRGPVGPRLRQPVELLDLGERHVDD